MIAVADSCVKAWNASVFSRHEPGGNNTLKLRYILNIGNLILFKLLVSTVLLIDC